MGYFTLEIILSNICLWLLGYDSTYLGRNSIVNTKNDTNSGCNENGKKILSDYVNTNMQSKNYQNIEILTPTHNNNSTKSIAKKDLYNTNKSLQTLLRKKKDNGPKPPVCKNEPNINIVYEGRKKRDAIPCDILSTLGRRDSDESTNTVDCFY